MNSTPLWQAEDVVRAVHGQCLHEQSWHAGGVTTDSRAVAPDDLYIALHGAHNDGHDHVAAAIAAGAAAAIVSRQPPQVPPSAPLVLVDDTLAALHKLGQAGRARATGLMIAVGGSVGKTTTKEMLRLALAAVGRTYASADDNVDQPDIALSLALANLPPMADYGIFEFGIGGESRIAPMARLTRPAVTIITTIDVAHLEFFPSLDAIADAKAEIFRGMEGGTVILNRDNAYYSRLAAAAKNCGVKKILSFGTDFRCDARLVDYAVTSEGCAVNARILGSIIHYAVGSPGLHLVQNSLAVLLAGGLLTGDMDACADMLGRYKPPRGRGACGQIALPGGDITLIDNSYDATPASVRAAIAVLSQVRPLQAGRRILVLGDMGELGETSPRLHAELAPAIVAAKIDLVFGCGDMTRHLYDALPEDLRGAFAPDSESLAPLLIEAVLPQDVMTVTGSAPMTMGILIDTLKTLSSTQPHKLAG